MNIVTKYRRKLLAQITSGQISEFPIITNIAVGDSGVDSSGQVKAISENQESLFHEVKQYPVSSVSYPSETSVRYVLEIPATDLVGVKISEAGLLDASGKLHAMQTFFSKQKDENVKFTFEFDDEF